MRDNGIPDEQFFKALAKIRPTCFDCCFCVRGQMIYCGVKEQNHKLIDDGFGRGDSKICEKFRGRSE